MLSGPGRVLSGPHSWPGLPRLRTAGLRTAMSYASHTPPPLPPVPPPPPPPERVRARSRGIVVLAGICVPVLLICVIAFAATSGYVSDCASGAGQFAQAFSSRAISDCGNVTTIHSLAIAGMLLAAAGIVVSLLSPKR